MKIGDKLYRYADLGKVFEYTVFGVIDRGAGKQLEIRCESCNDHNSCEVLVHKNGSDYVYKEMGNNSDDQYMWHNDGFYRTTKKEALNDMYQKMISNHRQAIETAKKNIDFSTTKIKELKALSDEQSEE